MRNIKETTEKEQFEIFDIVFGTTHSPGFKKAEVKDLFSEDYWFMEYPKEEWKENLIQYCTENKIELPKNRFFL